MQGLGGGEGSRDWRFEDVGGWLERLETSGLGGRFPVGYPVAEVTSVALDETSVFAEVKVRPLAQTNQSRFLLVVFTAEQARAARLEGGS